MKVVLRNPRREVEVAGNRRVKDVLRELDIIPETVLVIRGEHAPAPTRLIADTLPSIFPNARQEVVAGAGHMGPITHADAVNTLIVAHIEDIAARACRRAA